MRARVSLRATPPMKKRLNRSFYSRPALIVAKELLGKYLVRKINKNFFTGKIVETEAYIGPKDRASHAFGGRRAKKNEAEYLIGGHVYIYLVYGMYWQFNISTFKKEMAECVLIRALDPVQMSYTQANGPGKLCRWLQLDKSFNKEDLTKSPRLWLEDRGIHVSPKEIISSSRVGIDYAGPIWSKKPWRFYLKGNLAVSGHKKVEYLKYGH